MFANYISGDKNAIKFENCLIMSLRAITRNWIIKLHYTRTILVGPFTYIIALMIVDDVIKQKMFVFFYCYSIMHKGHSTETKYNKI